jgi:hypothetical protein
MKRPPADLRIRKQPVSSGLDLGIPTKLNAHSRRKPERRPGMNPNTIERSGPPQQQEKIFERHG